MEYCKVEGNLAKTIVYASEDGYKYCKVRSSDNMIFLRCTEYFKTSKYPASAFIKFAPNFCLMKARSVQHVDKGFLTCSKYFYSVDVIP